MEEHGEEPDGSRIRPLPLIGGIVLGFVATWLMFAVVLVWLYATYGDASSTTQDVVAVVGLLALPVGLALLLIPRRTRQAGAGLIMGIALGSISAAGVCGGFIGLNAV